MSDSSSGNHRWWLGFHTRARAVQRTGAEGVLLCALGLFAGPSALAHDLYAKFIQHTVRVVAHSNHIDLELDLTFFEEESARERTVMDTDRDGRVSKSEQDLYYDFLNLGCKLTASAGSDVPWGGTIGEVRAYAYLGRARFSADGWLDAFRRGRTFTSSGPMLEFRVDDALPGDEIQVRGNRPLRVRAKAWGDPLRAGEMTLEIVRHGEVIRSTASENAQSAQAKLDFTLDPGDGCWIAARARAADGTFAHTTPVYVVREGLRFWKYAALEELFARRLASLGEIEQIIAEARRLDAEGKLSADRYRKQLALQGDDLQQRVTQARAMYDNLRKVAEAERPRRRTAP